MTKFSASITHNEFTIPILVSAISDTFHKTEKYSLFAFGLGLLVAGIRIGVTTVNGLCFLLLAVIVIPAVILQEKLKINKQIKELNGKTITIKYSFKEEAIFCYEKGMGKTFAYKKMISLVDKKNYFFLFFGKDKGLMIDKKTLSPHNEAAFKEFMASKSGLKWNK